MSTLIEHKILQTCLPTYPQQVGWTFIPHDEAERRRGFDPSPPSALRAGARSLCFALNSWLDISTDILSVDEAPGNPSSCFLSATRKSNQFEPNS